MTTKVYRDIDGVYSLAKVAGSLIALFDAVLIDLGWTKEFSGANIAAYRNSTTAAGSSGCYLRVDNTNANYAHLRVYKTMSDINTGTDPCPTLAQQSSGPRIFIGTTWKIIGDERTFYMGVQDGSVMSSTFVGDWESFVPGNGYNYGLVGQDAVGANYDAMTYLGGYNYTKTVGRDPTNLAAEGATYFLVEGYRGVASGFGQDVGPNPYTGMYMVYPALVRTSTGAVVGRLRGAYGLANNRPTAFHATIPWSVTSNNLVSLPNSGNISGGIVISQDNWA